MAEHIFADGIVNVTVTGNLVRLDLGAVSVQPGGKDKKAETKMVISQRLVMPLEGFLRSVQLQEQVMGQLVKDGVVKAKKREPAAEAKKVASADAKKMN